MKKSHFFALLLGVVGELVFALGMCMCLLPEWNALSEGRLVTAVGLALLLALGVAGLVRRPQSGRPFNWKTAGKTVYGVIAALVLGVGMCMVTVWQMMLPGIAVGVAGMVLLLCLIPICLGFKK